MADNTTLNAGAGGDVIATDDIGGVKYQRMKVGYGRGGVYSGDVAVSNPLPVDMTQASSEFGTLMVGSRTNQAEATFAGSGTTLVAALLEGRRAIGIERNDEYFTLATARVLAPTRLLRVTAHDLDALYRRDLVYSVEYATTVSVTMPSMIFGDATMSPRGPGVARSLLS